MPKNKGGREVRKPKQAKKPKDTMTATPVPLRTDGVAKKKTK